MVHPSCPREGTRYWVGSSRQRHDDGGDLSRDPAESSEPEDALEALQDQPEDGRRPAHGAEGSGIDRAVTRGPDGRRLAPSCVPAARRLPRRAPGDDPAFAPLIAIGACNATASRRARRCAGEPEATFNRLTDFPLTSRALGQTRPRLRLSLHPGSCHRHLVLIKSRSSPE